MVNGNDIPKESGFFQTALKSCVFRYRSGDSPSAFLNCLEKQLASPKPLLWATSWLTEGGRKYVNLLKKAVKSGKLPVEILRDNAQYTVGMVLRAVKAQEPDRSRR